MKHLGTKTLETERLILRRFKVSDAAAMYKNWASDTDVTKFLMWAAHDSVSVSESILNEWIPCYENDNYYQWAIIIKENGDEPVGSIAVVKQDDSIEMAHIGYCIGKAWWNKGVTSEALERVIKFLFDEVKLNRIESRHDPRNENSGKVMMKCGMKYEGTHRSADWNNQGICDAAYYAILADDYYSFKKG